MRFLVPTQLEVLCSTTIVSSRKEYIIYIILEVPKIRRRQKEVFFIGFAMEVYFPTIRSNGAGNSSVDLNMKYASINGSDFRPHLIPSFVFFWFFKSLQTSGGRD